MILLHFTQFSDSAFCIPEGHQACTGARHFPTANIPCALTFALAITLRTPSTKGVSVLRTETTKAFPSPGGQVSSVFPLLTQSRIFRVAASRVARPLFVPCSAVSVLPLDSAPAPFSCASLRQIRETAAREKASTFRSRLCLQSELPYGSCHVAERTRRSFFSSTRSVARNRVFFRAVFSRNGGFFRIPPDSDTS